MAWTTSNPVSIGDPTKKSHYDNLWDNAAYNKANKSVQNLLRNPMSVMSNSTLEDHPDKSQITITDVTAGVCLSADTQTIAIGDVFRFDSGDFDTEVYKVTAVTANVSFSLSDTTLADSGAPGTGYEVVPACIAADALAYDLWVRTDTTIGIYRIMAEDQFTTHSELYATKSVPTAQNDFLYFIDGDTDGAAFLERFRGREVTVQAKVISSTAADIKLVVDDGSAEYSTAHTGGGTEETLEVTSTVNNAATALKIGFIHTAASPGDAYITDMQISLAAEIGEGNYQPPSPHKVFFEAKKVSVGVKQSALSDASDVAFDVEVDSSMVVPVTAMECQVFTSVNDSGSSGDNTFMQVKKSATSPVAYVQCGALANDFPGRATLDIDLHDGPSTTYTISASGSGTFDIADFDYVSAILK